MTDYKFVEPTQADPSYVDKSLSEIWEEYHKIQLEMIRRLTPDLSPEDLQFVSDNWSQFNDQGGIIWNKTARHVEIADGARDTVDHFVSYNNDKSLAYAQFFFLLHRLPAMMKFSMSDQIKPFKLFCDYQGTRYRVTGASRLGDVWLQSNFDRDSGYDYRVLLKDCSNWSKSPGI